MGNLIKSFVVSVYYLMYLTMDKWMNAIFFVLLVLATIVGFFYTKNKKKMVKRPGLFGMIGCIILYVPIVCNVLKTGGIDAVIQNEVLRWLYYFMSIVFSVLISQPMWEYLLVKESEVIQENSALYQKIKKGICITGVVSIIPVIMISPYIFARADDYGFGYHCRAAWEDTASIWQVIKAAFVMIEEAYFDWQGTYSSIFLMSLQPAVFNEKLYCIVPMFFVIIIVAASYFLLKTLLIDWMKADKISSQICIWIYILLGIQCVPVIQSAFFWYNGAIHYIGSHCMQLCMIAFLIRLYIGKTKWWDYLGCIISAIYVGGGNHVTSVSTLFMTLTIVFVVAITKSWKKYKNFIVICIIYWTAMAINFIAPGNYSKMGNAKGIGLIESFVQAFLQSVRYLLGEWMNWTIIMAILFMLPFIWKIVFESKATFRYPLIIIGYSWCYLASLFFSPIFATGAVHAGRYKNVMFLQGMLLLLFDMAYLFGWMQRKYNLTGKANMIRREKRYLGIVGLCIALGLSLSYFAEPMNYLTFGCIETLRESETLQEYASDYWENVQLFTSGEDNIYANNLNNIPEFLDVKESEIWHSGVRAFYRFHGLNFK